MRREESLRILEWEEIAVHPSWAWVWMDAGCNWLPGKRSLEVAHNLGFYGDGISFLVVFDQSF